MKTKTSISVHFSPSTRMFLCHLRENAITETNAFSTVSGTARTQPGRFIKLTLVVKGTTEAESVITLCILIYSLFPLTSFTPSQFSLFIHDPVIPSIYSLSVVSHFHADGSPKAVFTAKIHYPLLRQPRYHLNLLLL